ncbi:MAG: DedA family protein [Trebonia sp.]
MAPGSDVVVRFFVANACGGIIWAAGMTYLIWFLGSAAEQWLSRLSWLGLVAAAAVGVTISLLVKRRVRKLTRQMPAQTPAGAAGGEQSRTESAVQPDHR